MIRKSNKYDTELILDIWLKSSIKAHDFIDPSFWELKVPEMRDVYLPLAETYIYEDDDDEIKGFVSLVDDTIAAIFVAPDQQGLGVGKELMNMAKQMRSKLVLTVYKENVKSIEFYKRFGFKILKEQIDENTDHPELLMEFRN